MTEEEFRALPFEEQLAQALAFYALPQAERKAVPFRETGRYFAVLMCQNLRERTLHPERYPVTP